MAEGQEPFALVRNGVRLCFFSLCFFEKPSEKLCTSRWKTMQRWVACLWAVAMVVGALIAPRATAQSNNPRAFNGFRRYTGPTTVTSKDASVLVIPCSGYVAAVAKVSVMGAAVPLPLPPPHPFYRRPAPQRTRYCASTRVAHVVVALRRVLWVWGAMKRRGVVTTDVFCLFLY